MEAHLELPIREHAFGPQRRHVQAAQVQVAYVYPDSARNRDAP
jgi:hypothetical protein